MELKKNNMVFFHAGDVVVLKQDLPNKPEMIIKSVLKSKATENNRPVLLGVKCFWFTDQKEYQEQSFDTKDLKKVGNA